MVDQAVAEVELDPDVGQEMVLVMVVRHTFFLFCVLCSLASGAACVSPRKQGTQSRDLECASLDNIYLIFCRTLSRPQKQAIW